jgi:hypothetical protein
MNVKNLGLSERTERALTKAGIHLVEDLIRRSGEQLLGLRNFGRRALKEVQDALANHSLSLVPAAIPSSESTPNNDFAARIDAEDPLVARLMLHGSCPSTAERDALVDALLALAPAEQKPFPWLVRATNRALPFLCQIATRAHGTTSCNSVAPSVSVSGSSHAKESNHPRRI